MQLTAARNRADQLLSRAIAAGIFPGAVLAAGSSREAAVRCYGVTSDRPEGAPVQAETRYDLASLSKLFTATALLQLLEQGELRLDDPVSRFLPAFGGDKADLRLRHLLTHTSGLAAHQPYFRSVRNASEMLQAIAQDPLAYRPGSQVVYSCLGFITLANVLRVVASQPLDVFLQQELLQPLGLEQTGYGPVDLPRSQIAPTEYCAWRERLVWGEVHDENAHAQGGVSGNAGLFSTGPDLVRFAQMMLRHGSGERGRRILSPATVRLTTQNHTPGLQENRGLGWQLRSSEYPWCGDLAAENSCGHTGFTGTSLWISPDDDLFIILLTNRVHPTRDNTQHIRFRPLLHNLLIAALTKTTANTAM